MEVHRTMEGDRDRSWDGPDRSQNEAATQQLSLAAVGDRCANCGAPLASDQRYCITCGERRGKPRFTLAAPAATTEVVTRTTTPRQWMPRPASGASLIAGIATLLLAMGVGVLIGHNSSPAASTRQPAAQVITVNGGGASPSASTAAGSGGTAAPTGGGAKAKKPKSAAVKAAAKAANSSAPPPPVVVKKAAAAAAKVVGNANVAPVTVTQGGSCANGQAGCSGGHFNGNFFGGG